jgi:hypothetical protein
MADILFCQLIYALTPTLVGLVAAWFFSARARKLIPQLLRFDLTAAMLMMVGCSVLFVISREIRDSQREYARYWYENGYGEVYASGYAIEIPLLFLSGTLIVPGMMFARLFIDAQRDDRWSREERRKRLPTVVSFPPRRPPVELKPQWID